VKATAGRYDDGGTVAIDGQEIARQTPDQLADLRAKKIGFIFQTFNLLPVLLMMTMVRPIFIYQD